MITIDEGKLKQAFCKICGEEDRQHACLLNSKAECVIINDLNQALEASRVKVEGLEDWEKELRSMLNGMAFPDQIVSHVKSLLKAEREKVLGEIEALVNPPNKDYDAEDILDQIDAKIAEIRGE